MRHRTVNNDFFNRDADMNKWLYAGIVGFSLILLPAAWLCADVIILKNGRVIKDVTIKEEGDILICETSTQSYFISKSTVENIIRTGKKPLLTQAREFIPTLPGRIKGFVRDYFAFTAVVAGFLILLMGLAAFKFIWVNIRAVMSTGSRRRDIIRAIRRLDTDEKSVLREFFLQQANTLEMPVEDRVVSGLVQKGILRTTRDKGEYTVCGLLLPVTLSAAAQKHIRPKTVGLPPNIHAVDDEKLKDELARSRPQFMYDMAGFYQLLGKNRPDLR
ncbi:MAG: hypothetical protein C4518_19110 [Desulfobacteraceae bacterium]|nr:MAG: hypothetical protein C4518_19110 [Desulfobacteraceae bacterium]